MRGAVVSTAMHSLAAIAPTALALILLPPSEYGVFAIAYLIYGFLFSLLQSFVLDPWIILESRGQDHGWADFVSVAVPAVVVLGGLGSIAAAFSPAGLGTLALIAGALLCSLHKASLRTFLVARRKWTQVTTVDALSLGGTLAAFTVCAYLGLSRLDSVLLAWGAGCALAGLGYAMPGLTFSKALSWIRSNRRLIRPLVVDTMITDAATVGTPFALLPLLGVENFGIYRGVANLSSPVRLVLSPIRPVIIGDPKGATRGKVTLQVALLGVMAGALTWLALFLIKNSPYSIGVLTALSAHALPISIFLHASVLLSVYPVVCRGLDDAPGLYIGRLTQTCLGIAGPLLGIYTYGVSGAIWGFSIAALLSGLTWFLVTQRSVRHA